MSLDQATQLIAAAEAKARAIGVAQNIAVLDAGGNLVAFHRMDGAWIGSINIAMDKAYTARAFDMTTEELGAMSQPNDPLFGIHTQPRIVIFGGGAPLKRNGEIIGAVGVSGGTVEQDVQVLSEALLAFDAGR